MPAILTEAQKGQFEKYQEAANVLSNFAEREAFANGFCRAAKIMTEVMDMMEIPSVDE